ncbi:MAG: hypothetical protein KDA32_03580 [Phycisphaerales bacterium]|nr:hypothetical protein [Phycisphaerales bacterium]
MRGFAVAACCMACCAAALGEAGAEQALLQANSPSDYVHRITLYDQDGAAINPGDFRPAPYSPSMTCGKCHAYETISNGWHFNETKKTQPPGRPGEPWLLADPETGATRAISGRGWPGTITPDAAGLSDFAMTIRFGHHFPGGGFGSPTVEKIRSSDEFLRWGITGPLEIDCMFCHSADNTHDPAEAERQIGKQNFRWAPTAALGLGAIRGEAANTPDDVDPLAPPDPDFPERALPYVDYDKTRFDADGRVFFNITRRPSAQRCEFCHVSRDVSSDASPEWSAERDVHIASGMTCVDCHRNGIDHEIIRGDPGEAERRHDPSLRAFTCAGCHGVDIDRDTRAMSRESAPLSGRLGSPIPRHAGIPALHFRTLTCTACHAGPWPMETPRRLQTALAHGLGVPTRDRTQTTPPEIRGPVFARDEQGRIGPFRAAQTESGDVLWPIAHNVRPAQQALGARGCVDCHANDAALFFGSTKLGGSGDGDRMWASAQLDPAFAKLWNVAFAWRDLFKWTTLATLLVIAGLLCRYLLSLLETIMPGARRSA